MHGNAESALSPFRRRQRSTPSEKNITILVLRFVLNRVLMIYVRFHRSKESESRSHSDAFPHQRKGIDIPDSAMG